MFSIVASTAARFMATKVGEVAVQHVTKQAVKQIAIVFGATVTLDVIGQAALDRHYHKKYLSQRNARLEEIVQRSRKGNKQEIDKLISALGPPPAGRRPFKQFVNDLPGRSFRRVRRSVVNVGGLYFLQATSPIWLTSMGFFAAYTAVVALPVYLFHKAFTPPTEQDKPAAVFTKTMVPATKTIRFISKQTLGRGFKWLMYTDQRVNWESSTVTSLTIKADLEKLSRCIETHKEVLGNLSVDPLSFGSQLHKAVVEKYTLAEANRLRVEALGALTISLNLTPADAVLVLTGWDDYNPLKVHA